MKQILLIAFLHFLEIQSLEIPKFKVYKYDNLNITHKMRLTPFGGYYGGKGMSFMFKTDERDNKNLFRMNLLTQDKDIQIFYKDESGDKEENKKLAWNFASKNIRMIDIFI